MATTYYPTSNGGVARLTSGMLIVMSRREATDHAFFIEGLIHREGRRAVDERLAGNSRFAESIQVGVHALLETLESLSAAIRLAEIAEYEAKQRSRQQIPSLRLVTSDGPEAA